MTRPIDVPRARHLAVLAVAVCALVAMIFPAELTSAATSTGRQSNGSGTTSGSGSGSPSSTTKSASKSSKAKPSKKTRDANDKVDALTASREEVTQKVASLDAEYQRRQEQVASAEAEVEAAKAKVNEAKLRVAAAQQQVEEAEQSVRDYAVEAYIRPPEQNSMRVLALSATEDASYVRDVLKIMSEDARKVVEALAVKKKIAKMETALADKEVTKAEDKAKAAHEALDSLDNVRQEQSDLAAALDDRLERAMSEAAALAEVDQNVADELARQEMDLHNSVKLPVGSFVSDTNSKGPRVVQVTTPGRTSPTTTRPKSPTTTRPKSPTTTRPKSPTTTVPVVPAGLVTWDDVTNVGGIWVHKSIATNVRNLLNAATAAGFSLSGGGYRDSASQIATRKANCGTTYYDIYEKPSGDCTPPTAIPGRSMHEQGKAMDLKSGGVLITSRSNPAFIWLSNNASRYGFYNLPSEPWHWSTNGH